MKLGQLEGLPEKIKNPLWQYELGSNDRKEEYDSLNLTLDVEELIKIIDNTELPGPVTNESRLIAQTISAQIR